MIEDTEVQSAKHTTTPVAWDGPRLHSRPRLILRSVVTWQPFSSRAFTSCFALFFHTLPSICHCLTKTATTMQIWTLWSFLCRSYIFVLSPMSELLYATTKKCLFFLRPNCLLLGHCFHGNSIKRNSLQMWKCHNIVLNSIYIYGTQTLKVGHVTVPLAREAIRALRERRPLLLKVCVAEPFTI